MAMTQEEIEVIADAEYEAWEAWRRAPCCPQCGETWHLVPGDACGPDYQPDPEAQWEAEQEREQAQRTPAPAKPRRELPADYGHRRETASSACRVEDIDPGRWEVHSPSGKTYAVRKQADGQMVCECPAGTYNRRKASEPCKHIAAVVLAREDPARLVEAIRDDLTANEPDIAHALALVERLGARALARP